MVEQHSKDFVSRLEGIKEDLGSLSAQIRDSVKERRALEVSECILELTAANESLANALLNARDIFQAGESAPVESPASATNLAPRLSRSMTVLNELEWLKDRTDMSGIGLVLAYALIEQHERGDPPFKTRELAARLGVTQRTISNYREIFIKQEWCVEPALHSGLFGVASTKLLACRSPFGVRSRADR